MSADLLEQCNRERVPRGSLFAKPVYLAGRWIFLPWVPGVGPIRPWETTVEAATWAVISFRQRRQALDEMHGAHPHEETILQEEEIELNSQQIEADPVDYGYGSRLQVFALGSYGPPYVFARGSIVHPDAILDAAEIPYRAKSFMDMPDARNVRLG